MDVVYLTCEILCVSALLSCSLSLDHSLSSFLAHDRRVFTVLQLMLEAAEKVLMISSPPSETEKMLNEICKLDPPLWRGSTVRISDTEINHSSFAYFG